MLDKDLTIERGLEEIGEVIQETHVIITPDSPYAQTLQAERLCYERLFKEGKLCTQPFFMAGVGVMPGLLPYEEEDQIREQLRDFTRAIRVVSLDIHRQSIPSFEVRISINSLIDPFREAILNAVEHGTHFCRDGNVDIKVKVGQDGILAKVSQPTPGLSPEQIEKARTCTNPQELRYESHPGYTRGMGLGCYGSPTNARVWFEHYTEDSPEFSVIILETRRRLEEMGIATEI